MLRIYDAERCRGCGLCQEQCPERLLSLKPNAIGGASVHMADASRCTGCGNCADTCPYLATTMVDEVGRTTFPALMRGIEIPFHAGCSQGLVERLLAECVAEEGWAERLVIIKHDKARFAIVGDVRAYPEADYVQQAIRYKREHPEKLVLLWYCDESAQQLERAQEAFSRLDGEGITVFHMLNYFPDAGENEARPHLCEAIANRGGYVARVTFQGRARIAEAKEGIRNALQGQLTGENFAFLELVFPCHWRLAGCPSEPITAARVRENTRWFEREVLPKYPVFQKP